LQYRLPKCRKNDNVDYFGPTFLYY
jgi:hypothetical protein